MSFTDTVSRDDTYEQWGEDLIRVTGRLVAENQSRRDDPNVDNLEALLAPISIPMKKGAKPYAKFIEKLGVCNPDIRIEVTHNEVLIRPGLAESSFQTMWERLHNMPKEELLAKTKQAFPNTPLPEVNYSKLPRPSALNTLLMLLEDVRLPFEESSPSQDMNKITHHFDDKDTARAAKTIFANLKNEAGLKMEISGCGNNMTITTSNESIPLPDQLTALRDWIADNRDQVEDSLSEKNRTNNKFRNLYAERQPISQGACR